jgi:serine/threonine-protein kinase RsbW
MNMETDQTMTRHVELKVPSQLSFLGVPDSVLMELAADLPCERQVVDELSTAVIEACTNAMEHGNGMKEANDVEVHMDFLASSILVTIFDHGPGFDFDNWSPSTDLLRERGRGIIIMREFSDELIFDRAADGRFMVRIRKDFPPQG